MANPAAPTANPKVEPVAPQGDSPAPAEQQPVKQKKSLVTFFTSLSPREKMIAGIAGCILVFFILDLVMFRPLGRHLNRLSRTIREKEELIPKKLAVLNNKAQIEKAHGEIAGYLTDAKISSEEEIAAYLGEIERVSQSVGMFISNINPVQTEQADGSYWLKVDIEGAGNIANIKKFVSELEGSNPSVRVSGMSLRGQGPSTNELRFRFSIVKLGLKNPA